MDQKWTSYLCGAYEIAFGVLHLTFPRILDWDRQLSRISVDNAAVMHTLNRQLTMYLFFNSVAYTRYWKDLSSTRLGRVYSATVAAFWAFRLVNQFLLFDMSLPVSQIFAVIFGVGTLIHGRQALGASFTWDSLADYTK
jgi:hypothetical protein